MRTLATSVETFGRSLEDAYNVSTSVDFPPFSQSVHFSCYVSSVIHNLSYSLTIGAERGGMVGIRGCKEEIGNVYLVVLSIFSALDTKRVPV